MSCCGMNGVFGGETESTFVLEFIFCVFNVLT